MFLERAHGSCTNVSSLILNKTHACIGLSCIIQPWNFLFVSHIFPIQCRMSPRIFLTLDPNLILKEVSPCLTTKAPALSENSNEPSKTVKGTLHIKYVLLFFLVVMKNRKLLGKIKCVCCRGKFCSRIASRISNWIMFFRRRRYIGY